VPSAIQRSTVRRDVERGGQLDPAEHVVVAIRLALHDSNRRRLLLLGTARNASRLLTTLANLGALQCDGPAAPMLTKGAAMRRWSPRRRVERRARLADKVRRLAGVTLSSRRLAEREPPAEPM
jgi:hypothetical protein